MILLKRKKDSYTLECTGSVQIKVKVASINVFPQQ